MITVSVIEKRIIASVMPGADRLHIGAIVSDGVDAYYVSRSDLPTDADVDAWLANQTNRQRLWQLALREGKAVNIFAQADTRTLLKALASWTTKKLNALYQTAGLPLLTEAAVISELKQEIIDQLTE